MASITDNPVSARVQRRSEINPILAVALHNPVCIPFAFIIPLFIGNLKFYIFLHVCGIAWKNFSRCSTCFVEYIWQ